MITEIWAKREGQESPYPLLAHLLDTASAAGVLWDLWLRPGLTEFLTAQLGERARTVTQWVCALHDIGKANPFFQAQLLSGKRPFWGDEVRDQLSAQGLPFPDRQFFMRNHALIGTPRLSGAPAPSFPRRHEQVSAWALDTDSADAPHVFADSYGEARETWAALVTLAHHGRVRLELDSIGKFAEQTLAGKWREERLELRAAVEGALGIFGTDIPAQVDPAAIMLLSGVTILADRIASMSESVDSGRAAMIAGQLSLDSGTEWILRRSRTYERIVRKQLGIYEPPADPKVAALGEHSPRPLQCQATQVGDGLWVAMTATGSGKTEAAMLRHFQKPERLLFLLPTMATTNAMMRRLQYYFRDTTNVAALAHGQSKLEDFYATDAPSEAKAQAQAAPDSVDDFYPHTIDESGDVGESSHRGLFPSPFVRHGSARLLAPVCVGTVDQMVMAALPYKWTALRMLALANAHIVVDEAHTLDPFQTKLVTNLLWWLGKVGARVTLLTATLPKEHRDQFMAAYQPKGNFAGQPVTFPSHLHYCEEIAQGSIPMDPYTIELDLVETKNIEDEHAAWLRASRKSFPRSRVGVICNTVQRAIDVARQTQCDFPTETNQLLVLHSRMTVKHRQEVSQKLGRLIGPSGDAEGLTLVGTQAVEASLDIDLDLLATDLAPASSIIQRAGRAWRHEDPRRSERIPGRDHLQLRIVRGLADWAALPYMRSVLARAWQWMANHGNVRFPEDVQDFVETASVDLSKLGQDDVLEEYADRALQVNVADMRGISWQDVLAEDALVVEYLQQGSSCWKDPDTEEDLATRLSTSRTIRCILVGDAEVPGAWQGDPSVLRQMRKGDLLGIRAALQASLSVSQVRAIDTIERIGMKITDGPAQLVGSYVLDVRGTDWYDPVCGLVKVGE
ncbi:MAG: CRISPR-associated helicase Cas3' [Actinomycetaceae bacterium]|nr:CRISPR-associated helicase Cas3' [Actinomycetaceae bacterium]